MRGRGEMEKKDRRSRCGQRQKETARESPVIPVFSLCNNN